MKRLQHIPDPFDAFTRRQARSRLPEESDKSCAKESKGCRSKKQCGARSSGIEGQEGRKGVKDEEEEEREER